MGDADPLAHYVAEAALPFRDKPQNVIQDLARLIGLVGLPCEEAAAAVGLRPEDVGDALALIPQFAALVDRYRARAVREQAAQMTRKLGVALEDVGEITEGEARLFRMALASYREVRAGEREAERRKPKGKPPRKRHNPSPHRSSIHVEGDQPEGVEIGDRDDDLEDL